MSAIQVKKIFCASLIYSILFGCPAYADGDSNLKQPPGSQHLTSAAVQSALEQKVDKSTVLHGQVSLQTRDDTVDQLLAKLLDKAVSDDAATTVANQAARHYQSTLQKSVKVAKDTMNYMLCNRGFLPSTEVGEVLLDEDHSLKGRNRAELARQKRIDEMQLKLTSLILELSAGMGANDRSRRVQLIGNALVSLNDLVGPDQTNATFDTMKAWSRSIVVPESVYQQNVWDMPLLEDKVNAIVSSALASDPVCQKAIAQIHKYSQHKKLARAGASVVETTLNLASLTPTMVGPAAQAGLLAFFMSTGGTEEDKIIREVYLERAMRSRNQLLEKEAQMALSAYQNAVFTRNPVELACSEAITRMIAGKETTQRVFSLSVLPAQSPTAKP